MHFILGFICLFWISLVEGYRSRMHLVKIKSSLLRLNDKDGGAGKGFQIPRPNRVIKPYEGKQIDGVEKFLMMYTCKICSNRNAQMVSKVAYYYGMVVSKCKQCNNKHLIADNENKLDFPEKYGKRIDEYLEGQGEAVQRINITQKDLEENHLVDQDGVLTLVPKNGGQLPLDVNIIEYPKRKPQDTADNAAHDNDENNLMQ